MPILTDPTRINLLSTVEVNHWCQTLNGTGTRLRNAIHDVGPLAANVHGCFSRCGKRQATDWDDKRLH